jgi:hypothetical protein
VLNTIDSNTLLNHISTPPNSHQFILHDTVWIKWDAWIKFGGEFQSLWLFFISQAIAPTIFCYSTHYEKAYETSNTYLHCLFRVRYVSRWLYIIFIHSVCLKGINCSSETRKCQSLTTMSHFATFLSTFCYTCLTIWHFFLLAKTQSQKSKTLLQICSM